jgi:hypothetical protein
MSGTNEVSFGVSAIASQRKRPGETAYIADANKGIWPISLAISRSECANAPMAH